MKLLIVEYENSLAKRIADFLKKEESVQCFHTTRPDEALKYIALTDFDCILFDISGGNERDLDVINTIKMEHTETGILIISACDSVDYRVQVLNRGADDFITKPFHLAELNARIKSIERRRKFNGKTVIKLDYLTIIPDQHQAFIYNRPLALTPKEYDLLLCFVSNKYKVISKDTLIDHFWDGMQENVTSYETIYTHIKNLRRKLAELGGRDFIKTVYGIGYALSTD